jgi:hypothetical protein
MSFQGTNRGHFELRGFELRFSGLSVVDMKHPRDSLKEAEVSKYLSGQGTNGITFQAAIPLPNIQTRKTYPSSEDS